MIDQIRAKIQADQFELSQHAVDNSILRHITIQEIREAFAQGEIIETIPATSTVPVAWFLGLRRVVGHCTSNAAIRQGLC